MKLLYILLLSFSYTLIAMEKDFYGSQEIAPTILNDYDRSFEHHRILENKFTEVEYIYFLKNPSQEEANYFIHTLYELSMRNYPPALYVLGILHLFGWHNLYPNLRQAKNYLTHAASLGHPASQYELGLLMLHQAAQPRYSHGLMYQWTSAAHVCRLISQYPSLYDGMLITVPPHISVQSRLVQEYQRYKNPNGDAQNSSSEYDPQDVRVKNDVQNTKKMVGYNNVKDHTAQEYVRKKSTPIYKTESRKKEISLQEIHLRLLNPVKDAKDFRELAENNIYEILMQARESGHAFADYLSGLLWLQIHQSNLNINELNKLNKKYQLIPDAYFEKQICIEKSCDFFSKAIRAAHFEAINIILQHVPMSTLDETRDFVQVLKQAYLDERCPEEICQTLSEYFLTAVENQDNKMGTCTFIDAFELFIEKQNYLNLFKLLDIFSQFDAETENAFFKSLAFKKCDEYISKRGSDRQKYLWGIFLNETSRSEEGYLYICQASQTYLPAIWKRIEILLNSGGQKNEKKAVELACHAQQNYSFSGNTDNKNFVDSVQRSIELFENRAEENRAIARLLINVYQKGIGLLILPDRQKALFFQNMIAVEEEAKKQNKHSRGLDKFVDIKSIDDVQEIMSFIQSADENGTSFTLQESQQIEKAINSVHVELSQLYRFAHLLLPYSTQLAYMAFHRAEESLWDEYSNKRLSSENERLFFMFEDNLFSELSLHAEHDDQMSYMLACALALRCRFGICLPNHTLAESLSEVLLLLKRAKKSSHNQNLIKKCNQLYNSTLFSLALSYYSADNSQQAALLLKAGMKNEHAASMALYADLCVTGKISVNGINTWDYGINLLKKVLQIERTDEASSIFKFAREVFCAAYKKRLEELKGTSEFVSVREAFIESAALCGMTKEAVLQALGNLNYYTLDEIIASHTVLAEGGNVAALSKIVSACDEAGEYMLAQHYLEIACNIGIIDAHLDLAELMRRKLIYGSDDEMVVHLRAFLGYALNNKEIFEKNKVHILKAISMLHDQVIANRTPEVGYIAAYYSLKAYQYCGNKVLLDTGMQTLQLGECFFCNNIVEEKMRENDLEREQKLIFDIGVAHIMDDIAWNIADDAVSLFWGHIHYKRYILNKPFLIDNDEHLFYAINFFERAKERHNADAYKMLSTIYYNISTQIEDPVEALSYLNLSLDNNSRNQFALYERAKLIIEYAHELNKTMKQAAELAIKDLKAAGKLKYDKALLYLASLYVIGVAQGDNYVKKDVKKGIRILEVLIEEDNNIDAKILLAKWYIKGNYIRENFDKGEEYLKSIIAHDQSHYNAFLLLGQCLCKKGMRVSDKKTKESLLEQAAQLLEKIPSSDRNYSDANLILIKIYLNKPTPLVNNACQRFELFLKSLDKLPIDALLALNDLVCRLGILEDFQENKSCFVELLLGIYAFRLGSNISDCQSLRFAATYFKSIISSDTFVHEEDYEEHLIRARAYLSSTYAALLHERFMNLDEKELSNDICTTALCLINTLKIGYKNEMSVSDAISESVENVKKIFVEILLLRSNVSSLIKNWFKQIISIYPIDHLLENIEKLAVHQII